MTWTRRWRRFWRGDWRKNWRGATFDAPFAGTTTPGVATFALDLETGYRVIYRWITDVGPTASGLEQRRGRNNRAKESYVGKAWLLGDAPVSVRTTLAKHAARGAAFLFALPHEEMLLVANATGTTVHVSSADLELCDYARPGQRVVVYCEDEEGLLESIDAVIQAVGADSITLDVAPGTLGRAGARIAPAKAIYFEPEQNFGRLEVPEEQWDIKAHAVDFDFARRLATLELGPLTSSGAFADVTIVSRLDALPVWFGLNNSGIGAGALVESDGEVQFNFEPGVTTLGDLKAALDGSIYVAMTGSWNDADVIAAGDHFPIGVQPLTGGETQGAVGTGAALEQYAGKPVWDWPIRVSGSVTDSMHALTQIIDMGGVPYAKGFADMPDWGRAVGILSDDRYTWQWFKLFMTTVRGAQKTWWLPSWRDDLPFVSKGVGTITVRGDVKVWWPSQRQHVQVIEADDTVTRAQVTAAVDNGDGTWTLTIGKTLASSDVQMVSWLELCRFERDEFDVQFGQHGFALATVARVVQA